MVMTLKRRINDLAPCGGFVFAATHNIQPHTPPQKSNENVGGISEQQRLLTGAFLGSGEVRAGGDSFPISKRRVKRKNSNKYYSGNPKIIKKFIHLFIVRMKKTI